MPKKKNKKKNSNDNLLIENELEYEEHSNKRIKTLLDIDLVNYRRKAMDIFGTDKQYNIIYADPPWSYTDGTGRGGTETHYSTMSDLEICNLPVLGLTKKDCILFIWGTFYKIQSVLNVIKYWGFTYKRDFLVWVKANKFNARPAIGVGFWSMGNSEFLLVATRGNISRYREAHNIKTSIITATRGEHSAKPKEVYKRITDMLGELPSIELFARTPHPGWDSWGNECINIKEDEKKEIKSQICEEEYERLANDPNGGRYILRRTNSEEDSLLKYLNPQ